MKMQGRRSLRDWWTKRAPRGQFWIYFSAAVFFNLGFSIFFFLFNLYLVSLGRNERSLGFFGSALAVGTLCGTIPAGIFAERFGLRRTLMCSIALAVGASVMRVLAVWSVAQIGFGILGGFTLCCWGVCLAPAVADLTTKEQRPSAFSLMFASGIGIAGIGGLAAGHLPAFIRTHSGGSLSISQAEKLTLLLACGIAAIALVPLSQLRLRRIAPRKRLLRPSTPFLRKFLPAMAVWGLVTAAFPPFAGVFFVHHLGLSLQTMGSIFSFSQLVQFCALLLAPVLLRWTGLVTGVMITQLSTAAMLFSLAAAHTANAAAIFYWGYMASQFMNEPGIYSLMMDRVPAADRSSASSYNSFVGAGSHIVASTAVGVLIVRFNYSAVLCGIAVLAIVASLLFRRLSTLPEERAATAVLAVADG